MVSTESNRVSFHEPVPPMGSVDVLTPVSNGGPWLPLKPSAAAQNEIVGQEGALRGNPENGTQEPLEGTSKIARWSHSGPSRPLRLRTASCSAHKTLSIVLLQALWVWSLSRDLRWDWSKLLRRLHLQQRRASS